MSGSGGDFDTSPLDNHKDAYGRYRVSVPNVIEAKTFHTGPNTLAFNTLAVGSATAAINVTTSSMRLTTTTGATDSIILQTKRYLRYTPGISHMMGFSGAVGAKKSNVRQRWGYFDGNNGLFFEQTSTDLKVVIRSGTSGSPVDTAISQSNWNIDKLNGTGDSGVTLDTSKHNLYIIDFTWHGAGRVRFGIHHNGDIVYCHEFLNDNTIPTAFMRRPSLPIRCELVNLGATASTTTFDFVAFSFQKETSSEDYGAYVFTASTQAVKKSITSTTPLPLISIRPKTTFQGAINRASLLLEQIETFTVQDSLYVRVILNPTTLTGASFASVDSSSIAEFDTAATAVSGGTVIFETYVPGGGKGLSSLGTILSEIFMGLDIAGTVPEVVTVAAAKLGANSDTYCAISWREYQ